VRTERVVFHQLGGDARGQRLVEPALHVDGRQLGVLLLGIRGQFPTLAREVGAFRVGLRADRHVLAGSHRHRAGDEAGDAGNQDDLGTRARRRDAQDEA
jgi:hypothetical protein